ncbi:MAG TPA: PAS domain-containing sensor histidine kinase [Candidatus Nitrosotalea sp.]|nr:PAS domain-containing sensor histidine kinase [Candidatus Nitrosotalea sp.]
MKENNRRIFSIDNLHKTRELEQEKFILESLYEIIDNKNEDLEKSRTKLKEQIQKLMKAIKYNQKRYMDLYEQSPDLYRTINTDGVILDCNNAYAERLGYSKDEIIGKTIFDHSSEKNLQGINDSFETWKKVGKVRNKEIWLKCKDGTVFPGSVSANNLYDDDDKLIGSNSVIIDITESYEQMKKLEESRNQIQQQMLQLKELDKAKDGFLAMMTHELRTPLVPIKSYLDMILAEKLGPLTDIQKERLSVVQSSTESLLLLVNDLLDAQKIELGQLKLTKEVHNMGQIIHKTVEKMRGEITKRRMSIEKNIQNDLFCLCDPIRIEQVLTNLLVNAMKFSHDGSGKILINLYSENDHGRILVKDNGIGITSNNLEKIFVKFYQIDASSTREYGGTGLGLSVCKGLIESHGGKIWAESEGRDKGAEIHIMLPLIK